MLKLRLITVIIGLPLLLYILLYGPLWSATLFFCFCIGLSVYETALMLLPRLDEIYKQVRTTDQPIRDFPKNHFQKLSMFCSLVSILIFLGFTFGDRSAGAGMIVFGLMIAVLMGIFATEGIDIEMSRVFGYIVSIVYGGLPWLVIWSLYEKAAQSKYVFLLLTVVWAGDTGAYFGGRFFGKHKMAPHKSPKKTWEGSIAGLITSIIATFIFDKIVPGVLQSPLQIVLIGFFVGAFGQLGDLVESVFKRFSQVKDSGNLLPGHGGILDRADGLLIGAPALWFIIWAFG